MIRYEEETGRRVSRSDKILEAKSAFGQETGRYAGGYHRSSRIPSGYHDRNEPLPEREERHHFGMLRMVIAGVLFFVLVTAFHFQVSYYGFNKENVKKVLADESHWNSLVEQAAEVMNTFQGDRNKK